LATGGACGIPSESIWQYSEEQSQRQRIKRLSFRHVSHRERRPDPTPERMRGKERAMSAAGRPDPRSTTAGVISWLTSLFTLKPGHFHPVPALIIAAVGHTDLWLSFLVGDRFTGISDPLSVIRYQ
jgi:hypothetical protein